jgi:methionyl-tRNA formyltransferase
MPPLRQYCLGMKKIKLVYFGSPDFSANFLEKILLDKNLPIEVKLIVTQPDSPVGRKQILTPTPVKTIALKYDLEVLEIKNLDSNKNLKLKIINSDLALVYAFGEIIPKEILNVPKYRFWNIHPSLLPKYRGSSPIASPLINGDTTTGVTVIKMDEQIDHGPIIAQESLTIDQDDKRPDLERKLTDLAYILFKKTVTQLTGSRVNELKTKEQDHILATYTKKLKKSDGLIPFEKLKTIIQKPTLHSSLLTFNLFRGLYPWPGIWTILPNGKRLKIIDLKLINGKLIIKRVQMEGKNEVDFETFNKAYRMF